MKRFFHLCVLLVSLCCAGSAVLSCDEEPDCSMMGRPLMHCAIYTTDPISGQMRRDTLDSLTVLAVGTDSVIINKMKSVHTLSLPLRFSIGETRLVFLYDWEPVKGGGDTLTVIHTNTPFLESMDCGYRMKQYIERVTIQNGVTPEQPERMENVEIINNDANVYKNENLRLVFRHRLRGRATP